MLPQSSLFSISVGFIVLFIASSGLLALNKKVRAQRGALSDVLNFNDIRILIVSSLIVSCALTLVPWSVIRGLLVIALSLYGFLVWLDALLFVQYRIEINRQTLAWFFTGSKGIAKGVPHLFGFVKRVPWIVMIPVLWIALQGLAVYHLPITFTAVSGGIETGVTGVAIFMLVATLLVHIWQVKVKPTAEFFTAPTLLTNIVLDDSFKGNEALVLDKSHQPFVSPSTEAAQPSELFGSCDGANIILITLESMGNYLQEENKHGIRSRLRERFNANRWKSHKHFCLCPNTTVSTNQMYTGAYSNNPYNRDDSLYPGVDPQHIKHLKKHGYTTMFLDSADIGLYDYHKLLKRIDFDHVWGTNDMNGNGLKADYRLWNMVEPVAAAAQQGPFFLHIINDQSHMPYETVDKQRFNRHQEQDARSQYMNAVEEADYIIDEFLNRLAEKVDLSNTILVFTGDHGESFGEYGYSFHSNSIILPQMQVPFFLTHPQLASRDIAHSCHFDLFPTFFDLLGITTDYPHLGSSLADDGRPFAYVFHSATLKGNTPANFGFLFNDDLYWVDRLFNQVKRVEDGHCSAVTARSEREYICSLLHQMLKQRAILQ